MALIRRFIAAALAATVAICIASCGGGNADVPPPPSLEAAQRSGQVLHAVARQSVPSATQAGPVTPDEVMNWAEQSFPGFFPAAILSTGEIVPVSLIQTIRLGNALVLQFPSGSTLQTSTNVTGPYTDIATSSPFTNQFIGPQRFFRIKN